MNKKAFYDSIRNSLFKGSLSQGVVSTIETILDECKRNCVTDIRHVAYILATGFHEAYHQTKNPDFNPVREGFAKTNAGAIAAVTSLYTRKIISTNYAKPNAKGLSYYGRGFSQITWPTNYERIGKLINQDLLNKPDLALEAKVAAEILVKALMKGWFTGKKLSDYINDTGTDFHNARRVVNGTDKAALIAGYAEKFYHALTLI